MKEFSWITRVLGLEEIIKKQFPTKELPLHKFCTVVTNETPIEFTTEQGKTALSECFSRWGEIITDTVNTCHDVNFFEADDDIITVSSVFEDIKDTLKAIRD